MRWHPKKSSVYPILVIIAFFVVWEGLSRTVLDPRWFSSPDLVLKALIHWIAAGQIWAQIASTLAGTATGFIIGSILGMLLGLALGLSKVFRDISSPYVFALYSMPFLAMAPLFVVWFGISMASKSAFTAVAVLLLITFTTQDGVSNVPPDLVITLKVMGANRYQIIRKVMLPAAATSMLLGIRTSVPLAVKATVFAELVASTSGLGHSIVSAASQFDLAKVFAALIVLGVLGWCLDTLLSLLERYLPTGGYTDG